MVKQKKEPVRQAQSKVLKILVRYVITAILTLLIIYLVLTFISIENQKFYQYGWHTSVTTGKKLFNIATILLLSLTILSNIVLDVTRVLLSKTKDES